MSTRREEIAWAAGLFEGEGCFTVCGAGKYKQMRAKLNMADADVVHRFHSVVGRGRVIRVTPRRRDYLVQWQWSVQTFETFQAVVAMLWPWLGTRRRERAAAILRQMRQYYSRRRRTTRNPSGVGA